MQIRLRSTGQVMYESEFRAYTKANGGPSWETTTPEVLEALGADVVLEGAQAQPTRYQTAFANGVEQIDGKWYTKYSVADMDADAIAAKDAEQAKAMRDQRNTKLSECDWTQVTDAPVDKAIWATYRQSLRDITKQSGFPWEINWPTQPE
jgi:Phage tail assembly chaperone protein